MSKPAPDTVVAVVEQLCRFPVKGMGGEPVERLKFGWHGPAADRQFAFLRLADRTGLPFLSPRRCPQLILYSARCGTARAPSVLCPSGAEREVRDPVLLEEIEQVAGERLHLVELWSHATDAMDLSLISTASIAAAGRLVAQPLDWRRFRPNIVCDAGEGRDYPEDRLIGTRVIGGTDPTVIHLGRAIQRCEVVDYDPDTAVAGPQVLAALRQPRKIRLGVYGSVQHPGELAVGDSLRSHR